MIGAIVPLLSGDAERVFSKQNLIIIKTCIRNRLLVSHVKLIITVNMYGPKFEKYDPKEILHWWVVEKGNTNI